MIVSLAAATPFRYLTTLSLRDRIAPAAWNALQSAREVPVSAQVVHSPSSGTLLAANLTVRALLHEGVLRIVVQSNVSLAPSDLAVAWTVDSGAFDG